MDFRRLRYFVAVAQERSFTQAATRLRISQPPLSRQIQLLENELGLELFERGKRPMQLTEAGRVLFDQALQLLERAEELQATMQRIKKGLRDTFRIGFVASTLYGRLPEIVRTFRIARPGVDLMLLEMISLEQIAALKERRIDVGFSRLAFDDPEVARLLMRDEKLVAALPELHPLASARGSLSLASLAADRLIVYPRSPRPSYADHVLQLFRSRGLKPASVEEVRELQVALGLVAAEVGVCIVPESIKRLRRDHVAYRSLDDDSLVSPIYMCFRRDDQSPNITLTMRLIKENYKKYGISWNPVAMCARAPTE